MTKILRTHQKTKMKRQLNTKDKSAILLLVSYDAVGRQRLGNVPVCVPVCPSMSQCVSQYVSHNVSQHVTQCVSRYVSQLVPVCSSMSQYVAQCVSLYVSQLFQYVPVCPCMSPVCVPVYGRKGIVKGLYLCKFQQLPANTL